MILVDLFVVTLFVTIILMLGSLVLLMFDILVDGAIRERLRKIIRGDDKG